MNHDHIALLQPELSSLATDDEIANKIAFLFYKSQQRRARAQQNCFAALNQASHSCLTVKATDKNLDV